MPSTSHSEVGADRDGPPVDARLDLAGEERLPGVLPAAVLAHQRDRLADRLGHSGRCRNRAAVSRWGGSRSRAGPGRSRRESRPGNMRRPPTGRRRRAMRAAARPSPRSRPAPAPPPPPRAARRSDRAAPASAAPGRSRATSPRRSCTESRPGRRQPQRVSRCAAASHDKNAIVYPGGLVLAAMVT